MKSKSLFFRSRIVATLVVCGFIPLASALASFSNVSAEIGISYQHSLKTDPVENHGGAAVLDVNGDQLPDFIFARYQKAPLLFVNQGDGQFADQTAASGLNAAVDASGFGAADFDNDGDQDLFVTVHEGPRFFYFSNDGSGVFTEEAVARGADLTVTGIEHKGYSVGLVDFDLDGFLDIYVSEWGVDVAGATNRGLYSALLKNEGEANPGHFQVVTEAAGLLQPLQGTVQDGFSSAWADFDEDGWPDFALVADFGHSQMYWNDGDGTFTQSTAASGVGFDENGMGVAVADYDADGLLDFFVTSILDEFSLAKDGTMTGNKLYRNNGDRNFQEVSVPAGVSRSGWGWGAAFFEYDNDGDFDLVATNGMAVSEGEDPETTPFVDAASDPTKLFLNAGDGTFSDETESSGIIDRRYGKAVLVADWDADGDEDLVVVNSHSDPIFYESDASGNGNEWLRIRLQGTVSNRDAIGTCVRVTDGDVTQTLYYNPSNAYLGQREGVLHFGLGDAGGSVDRIEIRWPTGFAQTVDDTSLLTTNAVRTFVEPDDVPTPPLFSQQPVVEGTFMFGSELELEVTAIGTPEPVYVWEKDGEVIEGVSGSRLHLKRLAPFDQGTYRVKAVNSGGQALSNEVTVALEIDLAAHSVARWWNEFLLEAIRKDFPDPTKHSRNLYHVSAAMWDAFWAYEEEGWTRARPMFHREDVGEERWGGDRLAAQREAISFAAYTVLKKRYESSPGTERSEYNFRWLMEQFGYDPDFLDTEGDSPAAVGNRIGLGVLAANYGDGANELEGYADTSSYTASNEPLVLELSGTDMTDLNRWQPLAFDFAVSQNGIPIGALVQSFLGVNWREVETFALKKPTSNTIAFDPGPPPQADGDTHEAFVDSAIEVIRYSSLLDPEQNELIDISPGALLNNSLGANDGMGRAINPYTGEAYAPNLVKHADYGRILAEFWADGPASETPPGHWNTLHNEISEHPLFQRRYMGVGPELSQLEWDVRAYLALNGGMHDAAVAAWTLKRQYDYSRPISMIRALASRGQASDPSLPSYNPQGIKLVPGLVEVITFESSELGERHEDFPFDVGKIVIRAWAGEPADPHTETGGVDWMLAQDWFPYQRSTFVSPAFAAYVSGHSTFSRAGAEVMNLLTGSPFFPGGMGEFVFPQGSFLEFEYGPSEDVTLQWATYYDAADQAGLSRLYGGIHVRSDDFMGRVLGARIGVEAFLRAHLQRNASTGTGWIGPIEANLGGLEAGETRLLSYETSDSRSLPVRTVASEAELGGAPSDGVFFVLPDDSASEVAKAIFQGDSFVGVQVSGPLGDEPLVVEFVVESLEPVVVLGAGVGGGDPELLLSQFDEASGELVLIARNDDWKSGDTESLSEALAMRRTESLQLADSDAAIGIALASGRYRLEMKPTGDSASGNGTLYLFGQTSVLPGVSQ